MATLGEVYTQLLQNQIIKGYLEQGTIPSQSQINAAFQTLIASNPTLSQPFTSPAQYTIDTVNAPAASASKYNTTVDNIVLDLQALYTAILENGTAATSLTDKTMNKLKLLDKQSDQLNQSIGNLLLIANNVEGYLDFVTDNFADTTKTDLNDTTCMVDNSNKIVRLPVNSNTRIPTVFTAGDVQFNILSRTNLLSSNSLPSSGILNAFQDQDLYWIQQIGFSQAPSPFNAQLIVSFPEAVEVNQITFVPITTDRGTITSLSIAYSSDGLNWTNVSGQYSQRLQANTVFSFNQVNAQYWQFLFTKTGYDSYTDNTYFFEVGAQSIQFFGIGNAATPQNISSAVFYSLPLAPTSGDNFNEVSLKACEYVPTNTALNYSVALMTNDDYANYQNGSLLIPNLNFSAIDPYNRAVQTKPVIVNGGAVNPLQNFNTVYGFDDSTVFRYNSDPNNVLIATYILTAGTVESNLGVWRNIGNNALNNGSNRAVQVNNVDNGWLFSNGFYSCEFYITEPNGRVTDFGPAGCQIDGLNVSGRVQLNNGPHKITTAQTNWFSINPLAITSSSSPNPDILYPYNHKYLIEGYGTVLYGITLSTVLSGGKTYLQVLDPNLVYLPVALYWGKTLSNVSTFDFNYNTEETDYTVYTFVTDTNQDNRILIKYNPQANLFTNENYAIIESQITGTMYNYVVLQAQFSSTDVTKGPLLQSYNIRLTS